MERLFAIGDVHGCLFQLEKLFIRAGINLRQDTIVFIGDYIDRGPDSKGVVDFILELKKKSDRIICLLGNHERMLMDYLSGGIYADMYLSNGGDTTLRSYGAVRGPEQYEVTLPEDHRDFYDSLLPLHETKQYLFVHAGFRPGIPLAEQDPEDLIWIRHEFIMSRYDFGKTVVFGHTPLNSVHIDDYKIGIDTGAVYGGLLTCIELPSMTIHQV